MPFFEPPTNEGCRDRAGWFAIALLAGTLGTLAALTALFAEVIT